MRKEVIEFINTHEDNMKLNNNEKQFNENTINNLLNILNKIESEEK